MLSDQNINFEDFDKLHVIKRLRHIISNWWKIQLNFTDEKGFLRGVPQGKFFNPANPICALITENNKSFKDCLQVARQSTVMDHKNGFSLFNCHAGFSILSLPIKIGQKNLGCIFADGFLIEGNIEEQKNKVKQYLSSHCLTTENIKDILDNLPILSIKDIEYLKEFLLIIIDEIIETRICLEDKQTKLDLIESDLEDTWQLDNMIAHSEVMQDIFKMVARVRNSDITVLITGENGTGKEGIAKALHFNSKRKHENFIVQNCGAINDNLLESELFGHVKGAFTSAAKDKKGLFELADRGSLFLDEIGDTSQAMQVKLLRVLQEGTFIPVGSTEQKKTDVRIIAATNKNLDQMVKDGTFREDLYYRLNVINIKLPPLKERKDDIPFLVQMFLQEYADYNKSKLKIISPHCMNKLEQYDWPGNIRELKNEIERLCVLAGHEIIIDEDLLSERIGFNDKLVRNSILSLDGTLKEAIKKLEYHMISTALHKESWNKSKVARLLGISRANLISKCSSFNLSLPEEKNIQEESFLVLKKRPNVMSVKKR